MGVFSCFFQGFYAFGRDRKSLVIWEFFLGKTEQPRKGRTGLRRCKPCNPMLRQCNEFFAPISAKTFCALSKALWARSADLTSVPGGLVCKKSIAAGSLSPAMREEPGNETEPSNATEPPSKPPPTSPQPPADSMFSRVPG